MILSKDRELFKLRNSTKRIYPSAKPLQELFEEQVERSPDSIAVVFNDLQLTYREINDRSNQLANYLIKQYKVRGDDLICLCLDRNAEMIIAILAVLKAGGAYVPIDISYPEARIKHILKETKAKLLLSNEKHKSKLEKIVRIDLIGIDAKVRKWKSESFDNPVTSTRSNNLAYVIYTSGSTGTPKGVMIEHKGVVNSSYASIIHRRLSINSKVLSTAPYIFDSFVLEMYATLFAGGSLFILEEAFRKDIYFIRDYCIREKITSLFLTTKLVEEFLHLEEEIPTLNSLVTGGEKLNVSEEPKYRLINEYGPTENSVCSTQFYVKKDVKDVPIGKSISNVSCYVLDSNLNMIPRGGTGELYIEGLGLSRGYIGNSGLTAEKFIANPFATEEAIKKGYSRLYKTGDLVRSLPDGNLEYVGRSDFQVKIRGYRIELGEIESVLSSYEGIKQSAVIVKERKSKTNEFVTNKYLLAYYVTDSSSLKDDDILDYLSSKLPEYMLPNILMKLDELPLTKNGKLDKKALPDPTFSVDKRKYIKPRNDTERKLCKIWEEVLDLNENSISIKDNFFRLGGDSITSIKLVNSINKKLGLKISINELFEFKSIEKIYDNVVKNNKEIIQDEYEKFII